MSWTISWRPALEQNQGSCMASRVGKCSSPTPSTRGAADVRLPGEEGRYGLLQRPEAERSPVAVGGRCHEGADRHRRRSFFWQAASLPVRNGHGQGRIIGRPGALDEVVVGGKLRHVVAHESGEGPGEGISELRIR